MREATPTAPPARLLSVPECARMMSCSTSHLWRMVNAGRFGPALLHIGRLARVRAAEFDAWIGAGAPPRTRWTWRGER